MGLNDFIGLWQMTISIWLNKSILLSYPHTHVPFIKHFVVIISVILIDQDLLSYSMQYSQSRPNKEATEHDVSNSIPRELWQEQVYLVTPAGVHQEHRRDKVQVPGGVGGNVPADGSNGLTIFSEGTMLRVLKFWIYLLTSFSQWWGRTVTELHKVPCCMLFENCKSQTSESICEWVRIQNKPF